MLSKIENTNATPKFLTENPSTSFSVRRMMRALITSRNKPRVIIVNGNVKSTRRGLIIELRNASTHATMSAVIMFWT